MSQHVIYDEKIFIRDLPSERYVNGRRALANFSPKDGTYRDFSALKEHLRIDWKILSTDQQNAVRAALGTIKPEVD